MASAGRVPLIEDAATLWELVAVRARLTPGATMLIDEHDRVLTFSEFVDQAERLAAGLFERGIGAGSRVTWQLPTRIETILLSMALARLGSVQNPVIPIYREREIASILEQTRAEFVIVPRVLRGFDHEAMVRGIVGAGESAGEITVLVVDDGLPEGDPSTLPPPPTDGDEVRWIYTTSGTTSNPKCVRHSDQTLITGGLGCARALEVRVDDVGSIPFPYAHIGGPDYFVLVLSSGIACVLLEAFVPDAACDVLRRHGVTITGSSTAFYIAVLAEQRKNPALRVLPRLRILTGGGAPKPAALFYQVRDELGARLVHGYGMTESPMITDGSPSDTDEQLANTEGPPIHGCELEIRDDAGRLVTRGVAGQIWVRGPMVCKGYLDAAATREAFDDDGFFSTGDVGIWREDGRVAIVGRTKDIIIRKGENISPREVEDVIQEHPAVAAVAVIGLPDAERGERVCAVIEVVGGERALSFPEIQQHCRAAGLATQKLPEQLEIVDTLPRNATMKVLKHALRERFTVT
jgi:cyclohexanecarboxylate-CoA ligase